MPAKVGYGKGMSKGKGKGSGPAISKKAPAAPTRVAIKKQKAKRKARKIPGVVNKRIPIIPSVKPTKPPALGKPKGSPVTITGRSATLVSKFVDKEQTVDLKITGLQSGVTKTIKVTVYPKT
tara:strand:- start:2894 stop:3259 length:366 start_codon:yes stop_codon:yes gene_type:complete